MKKIYDSGVLTLVPCNRGFVFPVLQNENQDAEKSVVTFKQHDFDTGSTNMITKNVFLLNKLANYFEAFKDSANELIGLKTVIFKNSNILVMDKSGTATIFNPNQQIKWKGSLRYKGIPPKDIVANETFIWCSYPENGAIVRYNLNSMRQDFRISSGVNADLGEPSGLFLQDNSLIFTCANHGKICEISLQTFNLEVLYIMQESVQQYLKVDSNEVILTKSGVYRL